MDGVIGELSEEAASDQLDVIRQLRASWPRIPLLAVLERPASALLDALHLLDVSVCGRPLAENNLLHFVRNAQVGTSVGDEVLHARVRRASLHKGLTRREADLLRLAAAGLPRRIIAERLTVSENTVKAQIRSLLRKTGARSLAVLGQELLRGDTPSAAGGSAHAALAQDAHASVADGLDLPDAS